MKVDLFDSFVDSAFKSFNEDEKLLAAMVYDAASDDLVRLCDVDILLNEQEAGFDEKVQITMSNMLKIVRLFDEAGRAKDVYESRFPQWSPLRRKNIDQLRQIARQINTDRLNCNISKVTSSAVGVLGGLAILGSFVVPPAAPLLMIGGAVAAGAGGATVFGTSITEIHLLKNCMNRAKEVKQKDEEDFRLISQWFRHSQELIEAFESIIGFSAAKEIYEGLKGFGADLLKDISSKAAQSKLKQLIRRCVSSLLPPGVMGGELFCLIPVVVSFFFVVILFRRKNSVIFDCVVASHRIVFGLMKLLDVSTDLGMTVCNAVLKTGATAAAESVTKATARVVAHGVFAGIGIALDVTNMAFASIDIHKGSVSPLAVQLQEAANKLEEEQQVLDSVFKALFSKQS